MWHPRRRPQRQLGPSQAVFAPRPIGDAFAMDEQGECPYGKDAVQMRAWKQLLRGAAGNDELSEQIVAMSTAK